MTDGENGSQEGRVSEEVALQLLYRDAVDNIRDLKRHQWVIAYYGLAIFAALIGVSEILVPSCEVCTDEVNPNEPLNWALPVIGFVVVGFGGWALGKSQWSLLRSRTKLEAVKELFEPESRRISERREIDNLPKDREYPFLFLGTLILGASFLFLNLFPGCWDCLFGYFGLSTAAGISLYWKAERADDN